LPTNVSSECLTCNQSENVINITTSINEIAPAANNTTQVMTF